jgi:hypothetical protein
MCHCLLRKRLLLLDIPPKVDHDAVKKGFVSFLYFAPATLPPSDD